MPRRLWLLVEWLGDKDVFSSYGVVNADSAMGGETNFDIGKIIFLPHNKGACRAKILKISDKKRHVKELKILLERQDSQMKNVLSLCMSTLKDMKTNTMYLDPQSNRGDDTDSSDDDDEKDEQDINFSKITNKLTSKRSSSTGSRHYNMSGIKQTPIKNKRSITSSTPFIDAPKLTFDQATQTDGTLDSDALKIAHLEAMLKKLYQQFLSLIGESPTNTSQASHTNAVDYSETEVSEVDNQSEDAIIKEEMTTSINATQDERNEDKSKEAKRLCIRRASAQTTNTSLPNPDADVNMIPIGAGATKLPVTVLNAIDWSSYSTATRQLLQAIFPRKVLATHSLTGKQSPAFANKPPKKALDSNIVNDIVDTVSDVCGVSKRIVRSCITTKCTDEAKLYRNRQQYKSNNESKDIQENSLATSPTSNEILAKKE